MDQPTWIAARQAWARGQDRLAGQMITRLLPRRLHPAWAAAVLEDAVQACEVPAPVHRVLGIARNPFQWMESRSALEAFQELRPREDKSGSSKEDVLAAVLRIAEDTVLITLTACQGGPAEQPDCGQWLPVNVRRLIHLVEDLELRLWLEADVLCLHWK